MLLEIINQFRIKNNVPAFYGYYPTENYHCLLHCLYMVRKKELSHAPEEYLHGKSEAVGGAGFEGSSRDALNKIFFDEKDGFITSEKHTKIICMSRIAYDCYRNGEMIYVTIRGW